MTWEFDVDASQVGPRPQRAREQRGITLTAVMQATGSESALNWNMRGLRWRGTWTGTARGAVNDAVAYNGSS